MMTSRRKLRLHPRRRRIPHSPPLIVISICFIYTLNNISALGYPKTYPKNLGTTSRLSLTEGLVHRPGLRDLYIPEQIQKRATKAAPIKAVSGI